MNVYSTFNRLCLRDIQKQAKRVHPKLDMRKAAGAFKQSSGRWGVELCVPGEENFWWYGRAEDAYQAKYKAWQEYLTKIGRLPEEMI
jgi:hypothetical protein